METVSKKDLMLQVADHAGQKHYEKFKQETLKLIRKRREAKEQKDKEVGQSAESESADN